MPLNTLNTFSSLPAEIRCNIFNLSKPLITTTQILEDQLEVPHISPPPNLLTTTHESRTTALQWGLKKYPIYTTRDWEDIYLSPEDTILQLTIEPSKSSSLNITWTELHTILGDALTDAKYIHIACSKPERLARLFMLPEGELVGVGESCIEKGLFGLGVVASDRGVRENLQSEVLVTTSKCMVEEISNGEKEEVQVWKMVEKAFERVGVDGDGWQSVQQLHDAVKTSGLLYCTVDEAVQSAPGDYEQLEKSEVALTEEALRRLTEEMAKLHPATTYRPGADAGGSVEPAFD